MRLRNSGLYNQGIVIYRWPPQQFLLYLISDCGLVSSYEPPIHCYCLDWDVGELYQKIRGGIIDNCISFIYPGMMGYPFTSEWYLTEVTSLFCALFAQDSTIGVWLLGVCVQINLSLY